MQNEMKTPWTSNSGPLKGVKVVDMTTVVMGPYATQILAALGADVIKVESPAGDNTRHGGMMRTPMMSDRFLHLNRGKRSVVLNLKQPTGRAALIRLIEGADVLVYNVRPQAMQRLGLGYKEVSAMNPRLIYVGAYGFSQQGPYAARPAYDDLIQGMVALPWLMSKAGGGEPRYVPATLFDRIVGLHVVYSVMAALFERTATGKGQAVEVPMFEAVAEMLLGDHMGGRTFEPPLGPSGYGRVLSAERRPFRTRDGYVCVLIYNDKQWESFFRILEEAGESRNPDFATQKERSQHVEAMNAFVAAQMAKRTSEEWLAKLSEADIPCAPLYSLDDLIDDPHLQAVRFFNRSDHPSEGKVVGLTTPTRWPSHALEAGRHAPQFAEHTREVLEQLGYSDAEIAQLVQEGSAVVPPA